MKSASYLQIAFVCVLLFALSVQAQTYVSGVILDETWTAASSPYVLLEDATIPAGNTLLVTEAVQVYALPGVVLEVYGNLVTRGGPGNDRIAFSAAYPTQQWDGIMLTSGSSGDFEYTTIEQAYPSNRNHGGGINCHYTSLRLWNCVIQNNHCDLDGGGVMVHETEYDITYTTFQNNRAEHAGGGIDFAAGSFGTIHHVMFINNFADVQGGAIYFYSGDQIIDHATFYDNQALETANDARFYSGNSGVVNSIIWHTFDNGLPSFNWDDANLTTYCCTNDNSLIGIGNFYDDPMFVNAEAYDYHLQEGSPCIDSGDPNSPPDQDGSITDVGRYFFGESHNIFGQLTLVLDPYDALIPASGGMLRFSGAAINDSDVDYAALDFWIMVEDPNGQMFGPYAQLSFDLTEGETAYRLLEEMWVPGNAIPGMYNLTGFLGQGGAVFANSSFQFYKLGQGNQQTGVSPDLWDWDGSTIQDSPVPGEFAFYPTSPNPFNAMTTITFFLPSTDELTISVYDINGRLVSTLLDGEVAGGQHNLSLDGGNLSSGVFFIRVATRKFGGQAQKIVLVK